MSEISERILKAIEEKNLSYGDLSKVTGIPKSALQRYATGETEKIPLDRLELISKALNISAAYFMGWAETPDPSVMDAIREIEANHKKAAELLGWGVTITGEDLIYREVVTRPANEQIALLTTLYQLNQRGESADKNIRTLRILAELVSVMDPEDQDRLVAFAEFTEAEGRKRRGLPPAHHQYQREE